MTNDTRSTDEIERDIESERAQMTGSINDLQKKFSVDAIVTDLGSMFRGQGGNLTRSFTETVGRNPTAVALVGVGLAWILLGQGRTDPAHAQTWSPSRRKASRQSPPIGRGQGSRMVYTPRDDSTESDTDQNWFHDFESNTPAEWDQADTDHSGETSGLLDGVRDGAAAMAGAVSQAAGAVRATAVDLTDRLAHGTEGFTDEAKARVLAARRLAHDARTASKVTIARGGRAVTNLFEEQPLAVGALAVAFGAALGGALPHSRIEDQAMGADSDRLFADAQRVFHEEREKATALLKSAATDAKAATEDAGATFADRVFDGKPAGEAIADTLSASAGRMLDGTRT